MPNKTITITQVEKERFDYLNDLRGLGITNMFGAAPYLVDAFNISRKEAIETLKKWMQNFNEDGYENIVEKD